MTCGIYILKFQNTSKVYVGQSINIESRYKSHITNLRAGNSSKKLQTAYLTYGEPSIEVLIECSVEDLNINENEAINIFDSFYNGFNSLETAEEMPKWKNILTGEDGTTAIYSNEQILAAAILMQDPSRSIVSISKSTGIHYATLRKISQGVQHRWIQKKHAQIWENIQAARDSRILNNTNNRTELLKENFCAKAQGIVYPPVVSPTGEIYTIDNLNEFCRVHDLQRSNFRKVLHGGRLSHKGWKLYHGT